MNQFNVNGVRIAVDKKGEGDVIVFTHTFLGNRTHWNYYLENMTDRFKRISYDLRGHGNSEIPDDSYEFDAYVDDLKDTIDSFAKEKVTLVGHSVGAVICLRYIEKYGEDKLNKLILISCSPSFKIPTHAEDPFAPHDKDEVNRFYASLFCDDKYPHVIERLINDWDSISTQTYRRHNSIKLNMPDFTNKLSNLTTPVLLIYGQNDKLISKDERLKMGEMFMNFNLKIIDTAGHFVILDRPEKVLEEINKFMKVIKDV